MRRRPLPLIALCLLTGLVLAPLAGAAGPRSASAARALPAAPAAPAQGEAGAPVLEAAVNGTALTYRTLPGAQVLAELSAPDGEVKGSSAALADESGLVRINFGAYVLADGNVAVIRLGGEPVLLEPGDSLRLLQPGAPIRVVEIPDLSADLDVATDRVAGTAPAGAALELEVGSADQRWIRSARAGADGRWSVDLAVPGTDILAAGDSDGTVTLDTPERYRFTSQLASLRSDLTLGANQLSGQASSGTRIALTVLTAAGQSLDYGPQLAADGRWSLQLGAAGGFGPVGPGPGQGPPPHRFAPGDRVEIHQTGGPLAAARSWTVSLPAIDLAIDPQADAVAGSGPADGAMQIEAQSVWDAWATRAVAAAADGGFAADFAGEADLGPGWRVTAWWQAEPGLRVGGAAVVPVVQAGVEVATLSGLAEPGRRITVTLSSSAGDLKSRQVTQAGADGSFAVQHRPAGSGGGFVFAGGGGLPAEQGDRIAVELTAGDPLLLTVPEITAVTDPVSDTVKGIAPAGARLRLDWGADAVEGQVGEDGAYTAELAGRHDIAPGSLGRLTVFDPRGFTWYTPWSAPRLSVELGQAAVGGVAAPGRRVQATLLGPDGKAVASAEAEAQDPSALAGFGIDAEALLGLAGSFYLRFEDVAGEGVPIRPGDTVRVYSGDEMAQVLAPPLDGTVLVESDLVSGRTEPGRSLRIEAVPFGGGRVSVSLTADETGLFSHDFAGEPDLRYNDSVGLWTDVGGHGVSRSISIPGLTLDLDASRLSGTVWPNTRLRVEASRDGAVLAGVMGVSGPGGELSAQLLGPDGKPLPLRPGDQLAVTLISRQAGEPLAMTVPELAISADPVSDRVAGLATPGGRLVVLARGAGSDLALSQSWPEIGPDGSWEADFIPAWDVAPGTAIAAQYRLPEGHVALRSYYVPQLRAEIGGPNVCGFTLPGGEVTAFLRQGAASLASARTTARYDGRFQAVLGDPRGNLVATAGGQNVGADLGAGSVANLILPQLDLTMDWQAGRLVGSGPADRSFEIGYPARRCLDNALFGPGFQIGLLGRSGPDGAVDLRFPLPVAPGEGLEIRFTEPSGHQSYRQFYRTLGQVFVDTPRVTGKTQAGARLSFTLLDLDLQPKGRAEAMADANGGYEALILDPDGERLPMQAEDTLEIEQGGSVVARIVVEPLAFDWSRGEGVFGTAKPSRQVLLQLKLDDGRLLNIPRVTSGNGQWGFGPLELPARASWGLDDVAAVRATIDTLDGHQIIFQTPGFEPDDPAPRPPTYGLFLPWLSRGASSRALALAGAPAERGGPGGSQASPDAARAAARWRLEPTTGDVALRPALRFGAAAGRPGLDAAPTGPMLRQDGRDRWLVLPARPAGAGNAP